jgi:hypothetical protein
LKNFAMLIAMNANLVGLRHALWMNVDRRCGNRHSRLKPLPRDFRMTVGAALAANDECHGHSQDHGTAEIKAVFPR